MLKILKSIFGNNETDTKKLEPRSSASGLSVNGRMKVSTLKKRFHTEFGLTLRLYEGKRFADEDKTLANIRTKKGTGSAVSIAKNMKVGNLEDKFNKEFGLKVQVASADDTYLCNNNHTLAQALLKDK
jgi:hypothetical protein